MNITYCDYTQNTTLYIYLDIFDRKKLDNLLTHSRFKLYFDRAKVVL